MIRLGLRLTLRSGREAALRVLVTAAAVALGVGLLLVALAAVNGLNAQTARGAWLDTSTQTLPATSGGPTPRLWWLLSVDQFGNRPIDRVDVAATGPRAPVPPGIPHLPGPGEFYASPALTNLLRSVPADELSDRSPTRRIGTIGGAALPSPNSLIIVIGREARQLSQVPGAVEVRGIQKTLANCYNCQSGVGSGPVLRWILAGGAVALLLPVLILIATASRLSAARREERFAAMRLVGATPRQISVIAAVEATVAAVAGVAVGIALFFLFRPLLYHVPLHRSAARSRRPFAPGDRHGTRRNWRPDRRSRVRAARAPPRADIAARREPAGVVSPAAGRPDHPASCGHHGARLLRRRRKTPTIGGQLLEMLVGFVLLIVGLVLAGPWLTTAGSRLMAKRASRPATLIAGRRLLDNPRAAFRFISGLVIALFVTSAVIGALSSIVAAGTNSGRGSAGKATLADLFCSFTTSNCPASAEVPALSAQVLSELRAAPGVRAVTVARQVKSPSQQMNGFGLVACDQLAKTPAIGKCAPGETVASVGYFLSNLLGCNSHAASTVWPSARLSLTSLASLPVDAVVVATNGSSSSLERARTTLERAFPAQGTPVVVEALDPSTARLLTMIQDMTDVVIVASLIIAACSLAVNIAAGLGERKRPFSLLRLTGVPTAVLHRVVALESAMPLFLVAAVSIVVGLVSAALYLSSQVGIAFRIPGIAYWATVLGGLAASLAIIASTFPLLNRITGPEVARNE